jgi:hypothetical protein
MSKDTLGSIKVKAFFDFCSQYLPHEWQKRWGDTAVMVGALLSAPLTVCAYC